jgi:antitoxin component of MazEF toxin-antitoxin module
MKKFGDAAPKIPKADRDRLEQHFDGLVALMQGPRQEAAEEKLFRATNEALSAAAARSARMKKSEAETLTRPGSLRGDRRDDVDNLEALIQGITPKNVHGEVGFGLAVGKEASTIRKRAQKSAQRRKANWF